MPSYFPGKPHKLPPELERVPQFHVLIEALNKKEEIGQRNLRKTSKARSDPHLALSYSNEVAAHFPFSIHSPHSNNLSVNNEID
jgi:hypothetical protein